MNALYETIYALGIPHNTSKSLITFLIFLWQQARLIPTFKAIRFLIFLWRQARLIPTFKAIRSLLGCFKG